MQGVSRNKALIDAGMKRARPIVMTTFAMSAGMVPAAAGWGVDGALRQGMGVAVIGGLLLSTLLSLVFVPAVFVLVDRLERWVRGVFGGANRPATALPQEDTGRALTVQFASRKNVSRATPHWTVATYTGTTDQYGDSVA